MCIIQKGKLHLIDFNLSSLQSTTIYKTLFQDTHRTKHHTLHNSTTLLQEGKTKTAHSHDALQRNSQLKRFPEAT